MKPLVYYDFEEYDGDENLVLVDKERLKEIFKEVYEAGFSDGSRQTLSTTPWTIHNDLVTCTQTPKEIKTTPHNNGFCVTCENTGV